MAIAIGDATFPTLSAQPFGYSEQDVKKGITVKRWSITGLLTPSEWLDLLEAYDDWQALRIQDEDTLKTLSTGTTILLAGDGPGGSSWSVNCWFSSAPSGEQTGRYISASVELVDAQESVDAIIAENTEIDPLAVDFGTVSVGDATITLLRPMESYGETPNLQLTASGGYYVSGPRTVRAIRDIEGTTDVNGWDAVRDWYEQSIVATPSSGDWFPITIPSASARTIFVDGIKSTEYTVTIQLALIP